MCFSFNFPRSSYMYGIYLQQEVEVGLPMVCTDTRYLGKGKVKLSLCCNWAPQHEGVLGSGGNAPRILDLGTR